MRRSPPLSLRRITSTQTQVPHKRVKVSSQIFQQGEKAQVLLTTTTQGKTQTQVQLIKESDSRNNWNL